MSHAFFGSIVFGRQFRKRLDRQLRDTIDRVAVQNLVASASQPFDQEDQ